MSCAIQAFGYSDEVTIVAAHIDNSTGCFKLACLQSQTQTSRLSGAVLYQFFSSVESRARGSSRQQQKAKEAKMNRFYRIVTAHLRSHFPSTLGAASGAPPTEQNNDHNQQQLIRRIAIDIHGTVLLQHTPNGLQTFHFLCIEFLNRLVRIAFSNSQGSLHLGDFGTHQDVVVLCL